MENSVPDTPKGEKICHDDGKEPCVAQDERDPDAVSSFLDGWRLQVLNFSLCLGLLLSSLDTSIVSTSIIAITDELQDFSRSSWIITAYLLTYTSVLIPLAKIADIYGRRPSLAVVTITFIAFSAAAGCSKSMVELCIFRALQGIGGGGLYGLTYAILPDMVAPQKYAFYSALTSAVYALSSLLGPLVGGAINSHDPKNWRWIFWLNIPAGTIALILSWLALPQHFPHHNLTHSEQRPERSFRRFDLLGSFLILSASVLLVAGLETGGTQYAWSNSTPIVLVCVGIVCWVSFTAWQWLQDGRVAHREPLLPWRVVSSRSTTAVLLNAFFVGAALVPTVLQLPQRFQIVDQSSPLTAGCRLLPLTLGTSVGSAIAGILLQRLKLRPALILTFGGLVQVLGLSLYTGLNADVTRGSARDQYVFFTMAGIGFGISLAVCVITVPLVFEKRDISVGISALSQLRVLGGTLGVSACASILNHRLTSDLSGVLNRAQLAQLQRSTLGLNELPLTTSQAFRDSYARGMKEEMYLITSMAVVSAIIPVMLVVGKAGNVA